MRTELSNQNRALLIVALVCSACALVVSLYALSVQSRTQDEIHRLVQMLTPVATPHAPVAHGPRPDFDRQE